MRNRLEENSLGVTAANEAQLNSNEAAFHADTGHLSVDAQKIGVATDRLASVLAFGLERKVPLVSIYHQLLQLAKHYYQATGHHLQVYGDIGELWGVLNYGIKLHKNYAQGSDGKMGNDFVEIKTITPFKRRNFVLVKKSGNFSKLLVIRIDENFEVEGRIIDRRAIRKAKGSHLKVRWSDLPIA